MKSTRGKLATIAIGGMIAVGGVLSGCSSKMNGASTISCEQINIVDKNGNTVVSLGAAQNGYGGEIVVFDKAGIRVISLIAVAGGGYITALGIDGESGVWLSNSEHGGHVTAWGKKGGMAQLYITKRGGHIAAHGIDGEAWAGLGTNEHGGSLTARGKDGTASLRITKRGGHVSVRSKDGLSWGQLAIMEHGATVETIDKFGTWKRLD